MALTAENEQRLGDAGLVELFEQHRPMFTAMAGEAYRYAASYVQPAGLPVRVDDVAMPLELALRVSEPLETYLAAHRLTQKYWYKYVADLILDRTWEELTDGHTGPNG
jgi:hypothetical protein